MSLNMTQVDWGRLLKNDRVYAVGRPWTEEELKAVFHLKIPADFVRASVLTLDAYEEARAKGLAPVHNNKWFLVDGKPKKEPKKETPKKKKK